MLLRYNSHICSISKINALFEVFRCRSCDAIVSKTSHLEKNLVSCSERVKHFYPKIVYERRETFFHKLDQFKIPYKKEQKLLKSLPNIEFESFCVKKNAYTGRQRLWNGSGSMYWYQFVFYQFFSENLFCFAMPIPINSSIFTSLQWLPTQSKAQTNLNFFVVETAIKMKLCGKLEHLNQQQSRKRNGDSFWRWFFCWLWGTR